MNTHEEFALLVDQLVSLNRRHRASKPDLRETMHPMQYAMEMCTVAVTVGRAIGSSTYIKSRADDGPSLVVVPNERVRDHGYRGRAVYTIDQVLRGHTRGLRFDTVYIDEPAMCFRREAFRTDAYAALTNDKDAVTFVLLGT